MLCSILLLAASSAYLVVLLAQQGHLTGTVIPLLRQREEALAVRQLTETHAAGQAGAVPDAALPDSQVPWRQRRQQRKC